jgi:hypothetical protein
MTFLSTFTTCLHKVLEESPEEEGEERTGQVQPLVPVMIPVIQLTATEGRQQQSAIGSNRIDGYLYATIEDINIYIPI